MLIDWILKPFSELTPHQLYAILQLRSEVFVVEQNCVYLDMDDKDQNSYHLMGFNENKLIAYTRLIPAGIAYEQPSIGRVITSPLARGTGAGKELMKKSIATCYELFGKQAIMIGAQLYLQQFYTNLGFKTCSDVYLEDGIEHIYMIKEALS
jgi:ElaA protein